MSPLIRRIVDHSASCNIHFHIGAPWPRPECPYWLHVTGDLGTATWRIDNHLVHDHRHFNGIGSSQGKRDNREIP